MLEWPASRVIAAGLRKKPTLSFELMKSRESPLDPPRSEKDGQPGGWADLNYYRLHGSPQIYYSNYSGAALERLRRELQASCTRARDLVHFR